MYHLLPCNVFSKVLAENSDFSYKKYKFAFWITKNFSCVVCGLFFVLF